MNGFKLHIVTPESDFYSGIVEYLSADTTDGKIGFLHGASPRVTILSSGVMEIKTSVDVMRVENGEGFICVDGDGITVISESCRFADDAPQSDRYGERMPSDRAYDMARAKIAQSIKNLKSKKQSDL